MYFNSYSALGPAVNMNTFMTVTRFKRRKKNQNETLFNGSSNEN